MPSTPEVNCRQSKQSVSEKPKNFGSILIEELNEIRTVRKLKNDIFYGQGNFQLPSVPAGTNEPDNESKAAKSQLTGLAFSGGGIRSATFALGVLQGLAKYKLLPRIDYLSTVSGGGYIGSWLTAWIQRCGLKNVIESLASSSAPTPGAEPRPVSHLRQFSNYLTPKAGLLNADALTAASIYLRNLLLNLIILTALLGVFVLLPRLISFTIDKIGYLRIALSADLKNPAVIMGLIALAAAYGAVIFIFKNLATLKNRGNHSRKFYTAPAFIKFGILLMLFLTCLLIALSLKASPELWQSPWSLPLMVTAALMVNPFLWRMRNQRLKPQLFLLIPTVLGAISVWGMSFWVDHFSAKIWMVFGAPLLMGVFSVCGSLYIGLMGILFDTGVREWLNRLGAWILIAGTSYMVLCGLSIYGPILVAEAYLKAGMLAGWLLTTIGGVIAGKSQLGGRKKSSYFSKILADIAPYVFLLGLLFLLSWMCANLYHAVVTIEMPLLKGYGYIIVGGVMLFAVALGLSSRVDVNAFSMHNFYRNRLIRCYIGASDDNRNQNLWTGFDMQEHCVRLCEMANTFARSARKSDCPAEGKLPYQGPYPILNATLNLVGGENLAWQKRKASSFIMSPLFCGYEVRPKEPHAKDRGANITAAGNAQRSGKLEDSGYRLTNLYANDISLGTAMAISGAAVSPSMGHFSSPAVAFLLTIFNLRLGQWLGNPRHNDTWKKPGPKIGLLYLFSELFSMTDDRRGYVYLSDGGHFENLGLYELVRRRCRYIIVCDAGQDKAMKFKELGTAIEKCRADFGIDIDIDVDPIRLAKNRNYSNAHCVVGKIKYDSRGSEDSHGIMVYIKASLTGDEPSDVIGYAAQNEKFPHQSTSDQWFDESQFESYRALGQHIAESVFKPLEEPEVISGWPNELLFVELSKHWYPPSEAVAAAFTKHSSSLANLYGQIRQQEDLKFLDAQLVPEWEQLSSAAHIALERNYLIPETEDELRAGFYTVYQMIQLMENAYIDLNLEREYDHPDNRGWMNIFRNWSWSGMFRAGWAVSAGTFGARFQSFCQRHLDLDVGEVVVGEKPEFFELKKEERQKLFSYLHQQKQLNFVEEKFLKKFIEMLALSAIDDGCLADKAWFPLEYYPLKINVSIPRQEKHLYFHFGFALLSNSFQSHEDVAARYGLSKDLIYFRVQDHVRKMGFGRTSLVNLLKHHKKNHTFIKMYDLTRFEQNQDTDYGAGNTVKNIIQDPLFPEDDERKKFDILFDSVRQGVGFI